MDPKDGVKMSLTCIYHSYPFALVLDLILIYFDFIVGYKLAFNYMKARRMVDAIDICHHVSIKT